MQAGMIVVTGEEVAARRVVKTLGMVRGNSVRARSLGRDLQALGKTIIGGSVGVYGELLEQSRAEGIERMVQEASGLGANAIVAARLATSQIMSGAAEVLAYGTPMVVAEE